MKIYLTLNSIEELNRWSRDEKKEAWRGVFKSMHRSSLPWLGYGIMFVLVFTFMLITSEGIPKPVWAGVAGGIGGFIMAQFQLRAAIPLMKEWLEKNRIEQGEGGNSE